MGITLVPIDPATKKPFDKYKQYKDIKQEFKALEILYNTYPTANWAVYCIGGIIGLDFDSANTYEEFFHDLDTLTTRSPSGGYHGFIKSLAPLKQFQDIGLEVKVNELNTLIGNGYEVTRDVQIKEFEDAESFIKSRLPKLKSYKGKDINKFKGLKIGDVVGLYCEKKKEGHGYWQAMCPIHGDTDTPHLYVYEDSNKFYCHKCKKGGLAAHFVSAIEGIKLKDVPTLLKDKFNIDIEEGEETLDIYKSTVKINGVLYEQILQDGVYRFVSYQNNEFVFFDSIKDEGIEYFPCVDEEVTKKAVVFCNGITEYPSVKTLLVEIDKFLYKWLDIDTADRTLYTYYILQTWLYDCFETIGYARALGTWGVGKTRFLDAIGGLCYKPIFTTGAINAAPVFRILDKHKGTFVMDEADMDKSDETQSIMKILNSGWTRGKPVMRCNPNNVNEIQTFEIYGPKVLATRATYKDKALESRCYTTTLTKTEREDIPVQQGKEFEKEQDIIKNKLLAFRLKNFNIIEYDPTLQERFSGVDPRLIQKIISLASIFKNDEESLNILIDYTSRSQENLIEEAQESKEGKIGLIVLDILVKGLEYFETIDEVIFSSKDIATVYNKGKPEKYHISAQGVGKVIKGLGFETDNERKRKLSLCDHIKNLNGDEILPSQNRQLVTTPELVRKTLKRLTFFNEEKYHKLRGAVTSVTYTKGEYQNNFLLRNSAHINVSEKKEGDSPYVHVTNVTHVTEISKKIVPYYSNFWAGNNGPVNSTNIVKFCIDCALHLKVNPGEIKPHAEKLFAITPKQDPGIEEQNFTLVRTAAEADQAVNALMEAGY